MHAFDHRLNQLLDRVANLSPGRRQRLTRSLRQDDVELGVRAAEPSLDAAMKASLRVAAHEVLDMFCVHLESALARCRSDEARTLLLAIVSIALAEHACVLFEADGQTSGVEFPAAQTLILSASPTAGIDLRLAMRQTAAADEPSGPLCVSIRAGNGETAAGNNISVAPACIAHDPFRHAASILERIRRNSPR